MAGRLACGERKLRALSEKLNASPFHFLGAYFFGYALFGGMVGAGLLLEVESSR